MSAAAPQVRLDIRGLSGAVLDDPEEYVRALDVLVIPRGVFTASELSSTDLYRDRWICATWVGNESVGERLTIDDIADARWVMPFQGPVASPADAVFAQLGLDRRCAVRVEAFTTLHRLVVGTGLLVLVHERVARHVAWSDLRILELPFEVPPIVEAAWSHPSRALDPGHRWLLDVMARESAALDL